MVKTIEAVFDGTVFRPSEPIALEPNTRVQLTFETSTESAKYTSFLELARTLDLKGPADWSANLEDYLYGEGGHEA